jgi:hypothetical protein
LGNVLRVATLSWLFVHFALTIAYVMPFNPAQAETQPLLSATIGSFFSQNWRLFAPDPVGGDMALLARCMTPAEMTTTTPDKLPPHGWHDVSTPLWLRFQEHRFSAYDRMARPNTNTIRALLFGIPELSEACKKGSKEACTAYEDNLKSARAATMPRLAKIGSAFCKDLDPGATRFSHVALRLRETDGLPWSQRYGARLPPRDVELGVASIDSSIAQMGIFHAESGI